MAKPNSKATLKSWCKRRLGYPVIDINVDDDQVDDRIDEALQYFYTFQYGGMQRVYLKHKITQADVDRANVNTSETATDGNQVTNTLAGNVVAGATTVTLTDATSFPKSGTITIAADGTNAAETVTYSAKTGNALTTTALALPHLATSVVTSVDTVTWERGQAFLPMPESVTSVLSCLLYTSPSPRDATLSRMPSSA